ncbi:MULTISPECIES: methyltransferase domain-containing protein [unclassified Azospirillum]|uniref:class I SAM-dependent methyltransferase n=1 Tax=unclassified Azospirillum TaxID=2630922 RepID=UPI000B777FC9|nr:MULTISPECIES: methyltransferase domain-containing protein [unclassified Azospirillum]
MNAVKTMLHVGCGPKIGALSSIFQSLGGDWREVRLDIDPAVQPDIIGSITDMGMVAGGTMDAVYSSHNLEHLYPHEVPLALAEFFRVLKPGGFVNIATPDLEQVALQLLNGGLESPAYVSPAGPIAPLDMLYGLRSAVAAGNHYMAHRTGFTPDSLHQALIKAGFATVTVVKDQWFALHATAWKAGNQGG